MISFYFVLCFCILNSFGQGKDENKDNSTDLPFLVNAELAKDMKFWKEELNEFIAEIKKYRKNQ